MKITILTGENFDFTYHVMFVHVPVHTTLKHNFICQTGLKIFFSLVKKALTAQRNNNECSVKQKTK